MTVAFDTFMKQHNMTGSEKADGYSDDVFSGLDDIERKTVFSILVTELPWSAGWLFLVDRERAITVAKEMDEKIRGNPDADVFMLQRSILKCTGDLLCQKRMIEDYHNHADRLKPRVVSSIASTPVNRAVIEFFKEVILVEVNPDAFTRASHYLLAAIKIPRASEAEKKNYDRLVNELRSDDVNSKRKALAEVDKYGSLSAITR